MRKTLIAGNWKLNGSISSVTELVNSVSLGLQSLDCGMAVCVPYPFLSMISEQLKSSSLAVAAQDVSEHSSGAFTGEVSAEMLSEFGCGYGLVGHSERRSYHSETDDQVANKFNRLKIAGIVPILCVGETLAERDEGVTTAVVSRQILAVIEKYGIRALSNSVIAYEPIWAIGTGRTATPEQAQEVHSDIRALLAEFDASIAAKTQILYGGSMNPGNASLLLAMPDIDGGLIGGASLKADDFLAIGQAA
jgi:triosephosphate isomerase